MIDEIRRGFQGTPLTLNGWLRSLGFDGDKFVAQSFGLPFEFCREHALPHQLAQRMIDLACLPLVSKAGGQSGHQVIVPIRGLQQQSPAVGTALALIKLGNDWIAKNSWEQQTLCCAIV